MSDEFDADEPEIDEAVWRPLAASVYERVERGETCVVVGASEWERLTAAGTPGGAPLPMTREAADEAAAFLARTLGGHHEVEAFSEVEPDGAGGWRPKEGGAPGPVFVLSGRDKEAVDAWKRARDERGLVAGGTAKRTAGRPELTDPDSHKMHLLVVQRAPDGVVWEMFVFHPTDLLPLAHWGKYGKWGRSTARAAHCRGPMAFDDRWRDRFVAVIHDGLLRAPAGLLETLTRRRSGGGTLLRYEGALPDGDIGRRPSRDDPWGYHHAAERALLLSQRERERPLIDLHRPRWATGRPGAASGWAYTASGSREDLLAEAADLVGWRGPSRWFEDLDVRNRGEADATALARAFPLVRADLARERAFGEPFFSPALEADLAALVGGDPAAARTLALRAAALDRRMAEQGRVGAPPSTRALAAACRARLAADPPVRFDAADYRARFIAAA